jgi:peptidylprolyl isomerase
VAANKGTRQQIKNRQAKVRANAAAAAAHRRSIRQRVIVGVVAAAVLGSVVLGTVAIGGGGSTPQTASQGSDSSTSAPAAAAPSVAGQPCVAVSDPLPPGAPPVPVKVGPPPTKLVTEDLKPGTGATVALTDTVTVNYIGVACSNGKIFDSSYSRNQPATFALNQVIQGWQDGIPGMKVGGERLLGIPPDQAYGPEGQPPTIAGNETLWFVVDVLSTKPA